MDLSKVTFPTFVLEPRSMLERITDFMAHPDLIFGWVVPSTFWLLSVAAARHPHCTTVLTQRMLLASAPPEPTFCDMLCWPRLFPVPRGSFAWKGLLI